MQISEEDYLAHFGVKGMKWGVRRDEQNKARLSAARVSAEGQLYGTYDAKLFADRLQPLSMRILKATAEGAPSAAVLLVTNSLSNKKYLNLKKPTFLLDIVAQMTFITAANVLTKDLMANAALNLRYDKAGNLKNPDKELKKVQLDHVAAPVLRLAYSMLITKLFMKKFSNVNASGFKEESFEDLKTRINREQDAEIELERIRNEKWAAEGIIAKVKSKE